jgi:hypothetical protein
MRLVRPSGYITPQQAWEQIARQLESILTTIVWILGAVLIVSVLALLLAVFK